MPAEPLDNCAPAGGRTRHHLSAEKPTIKILLYTDDPNEATPDNNPMGIGTMIQHIEAHAPAFANLRVVRVSRSSGPDSHADNKIDEVLQKECDAGQPYDEIWFFGFHQARLETFSLGVDRGGPESELDKNEVSALRKWMTVGDEPLAVGGGVLVTGDHSNKRPQGIIPSQNEGCPPSTATAEFLGLGRALGRCVPRAGLLRQWDGGPTYRDEDSHNTVAGSGLQQDSVPQPLLHRHVNAVGDPDPRGRPHPIFYYRPGLFINVFPDHAHEGAVIVPDGALDKDEWPFGKDAAGNDVQPRPHVIAFGFDARTARLLNLLAAYNGDRANVGRIVADSTWHHYVHLNLGGFPPSAPAGSDSDKIGQFYANLAVWLTSATGRHRMGLAMLWRLATLTMLLENPDDLLGIGRFAFSTLTQVASPCEVHELIQAVTPERYKELYYPDEAAISPIPSKEILLGCVLRSYHEEMVMAESADASFQPRAAKKVIEEGFTKAFQVQAELLSQMASEALALRGNNPS